MNGNWDDMFRWAELIALRRLFIGGPTRETRSRCFDREPGTIASNGMPLVPCTGIGLVLVQQMIPTPLIFPFMAVSDRPRE